MVYPKSRLYGETLSRKTGSPSHPSQLLRAVHMKKRVDPFTRANSVLARCGCLALTEVTRPGGPKLLGSSDFRAKKSELLA